MYRRIWSKLRDVLGTIPFDLVILNDADPVIRFDVIREGEPVYSRSDEELNAFERRAWQRYQDTRPLRAIGDMYLSERSREWSSRRSASGDASSGSRR